MSFTEDWSLPDAGPETGADITFLSNPNSPSGTFVPENAVRRLADDLPGPLVADEAYVDFAGANMLALSQERGLEHRPS